jgi:hypothetical protein
MANSLQEENNEIHNQLASVLVVDSTVNDAKYVSNTCMMSNYRIILLKYSNPDNFYIMC